MIVVPWIDAPRWRQEIALDGRPYVLVARYNVRSAFYSMDIMSRTGEAIVSGFRLVKGFPLLRQVRKPELPPGEFFVIGTGEPTRENMGQGCKLIYIPEADLDAV